jgi:hypothetical protein
VDCYLVCAQDEARAWLWSRGPDRVWPLQAQVIEGLDGAVDVPALGVSIPLAEIYRRVPV